jgi:hydroxyacylglutathione hydrolase
MFFHRLYEDNIAQASYLIGCEKTRDAIVIDPTRDIDRYLSVARSQKLHIRYVTETHIHADFASGSRALAASCDAKLLLSGEGGSDWQYRFASEADAHLLRNGNRIEVGRLRIDVLHTPGHTPEHLTFLVTDLEMGGSPVGAVTGDFLFVGDVGRVCGLDGVGSPHASRVAQGVPRATGPPADLARPWRRLGVR